jgi:hypothetical protein
MWQNKKMRVTVDIPQSVYRRLKARAEGEVITVQKLILRGVEQVLKENRSKPGRRVKLPLVPSKRPGTLHLDNAKIDELIFSPDANARLAEGLDELRGGRVYGPFRSARALRRSLRRTKRSKNS